MIVSIRFCDLELPRKFEDFFILSNVILTYKYRRFSGV